jgi:hypothetical protein
MSHVDPYADYESYPSMLRAHIKDLDDVEMRLVIDAVRFTYYNRVIDLQEGQPDHKIDGLRRHRDALHKILAKLDPPNTPLV